MRNFVRLAIVIAILLGSASLGIAPAFAQGSPGFAVGGNYNYVRANAPPGDCGCFSMNGGNGWVSIGLTHHIAAVADVGGQYASNINGSSVNLTLISYVFGARYTFLSEGRAHPFAQGLVGGAHATASFSGASSSGSANSFAAIAGGGFDYDVTEHIGVRVFEADYYSTQFSNGGNDHQNNLRIAAGIYFRFGRR